VSKGKLAKFAEMAIFPNVLQPSFEEVFQKVYSARGKWNDEYFKNIGPITLELGCGKGEYTVGLAKRHPEQNFIGIDIKGSRIWKGAKTALETGLSNVFFLRTRIDFVESFFAPDEVNDIWITFPDPQPKKPLKRLTSSRFLNRYRSFLQPGGLIHLKTDSRELYNYTVQVAEYNGLPIRFKSNDLYRSHAQDEILSLRTFYEKMWLEMGKRINYICFSLNEGQTLKEPPGEEGRKLL
jgi:tRNA (guanine-N7-)-methyltransferase